jgi:multidrug resistance efflux pump
VQESLSPKLVGSLGLLVLLASLIKQYFRPEVSVENARKKVAQLKALIRTSEDQLAILDAKIASGQDHTYAMISLLTKITDRLTEIETPEVIEQIPEPPEKSA